MENIAGMNLMWVKCSFNSLIRIYLFRNIIYRCIDSNEDDVSAKPGTRGKYLRSAERRNAVKAHIFLYNPTISHYRREHAPNRLYLPADITAKQMFQHYQDTHPELQVSYTFFCRMLKELNISIVKLGHEECEACVGATQHQDLLGHKDEEAKHGCSVCVKHEEHMRLAKQSREAYRSDGDKVEPDEIVLAVDLQKVSFLVLRIAKIVYLCMLCYKCLFIGHPATPSRRLQNNCFFPTSPSV